MRMHQCERTLRVAAAAGLLTRKKVAARQWYFEARVELEQVAEVLERLLEDQVAVVVLVRAPVISAIK